MSRKNKKAVKKKAKSSFDHQKDMKYAPLGWVVLSGPLFIVLFLVITGGEMSFLQSTAAEEEEIHAAKYNEKGTHFLEQKQYNKAFQAYMQAHITKKTYVNPIVNLSKIYYLRKDYPQAISWIEKAIQLDPPQIGLLCNNAGLLYAQSEKYDKALEFFERAADSKMLDADIYRNLGKIYSFLENPEKSVLAFGRAIELHTSIQTVYDKMLINSMADTYQKKGKEDQYEQINKHYTDALYKGKLEKRYDSNAIDAMLVDKRKMAGDYYSLSIELQKIGKEDEAKVAFSEYEVIAMSEK